MTVSVKTIVLFTISAMLFQTHLGLRLAQAQEQTSGATVINLLQPGIDGPVSIEKALLERRSVRSYKDEPLTIADISQILWAAQGITEPKRGLRTAPSARAMYLLNAYLIVGNVTGLSAGMYKYQPQGHKIVKVANGDKKADLYKAVGQVPIKNAPATLVFSGMSDRSPNPRWMYLEGGHAAQNVFLQAQSLKLGTVTIGGFKDEDVRKALNLSEKEQPIYIMPLGRK
ncbi:MAG: SagB/ThcOx family dehydrogenase [Deltaproteobacteria bacterium]|nr:SagB/ThcOx family dehydrogenase [Deltaproteobacteria bacterium]